MKNGNVEISVNGSPNYGLRNDFNDAMEVKKSHRNDLMGSKMGNVVEPNYLVL